MTGAVVPAAPVHGWGDAGLAGGGSISTLKVVFKAGEGTRAGAFPHEGNRDGRQPYRHAKRGRMVAATAAIEGRAAFEPPAPVPTAESPPHRSADKPRDAAATPPPGFIPLSSLGIPGIDALILSHADFYREAYEKAVRKGQPGSPAPTSAAPREDGGAESPSDAPLPAPESEAGPETGEARRPAA